MTGHGSILRASMIGHLKRILLLEGENRADWTARGKQRTSDGFNYFGGTDQAVGILESLDTATLQYLGSKYKVLNEDRPLGSLLGDTRSVEWSDIRKSCADETFDGLIMDAVAYGETLMKLRKVRPLTLETIYRLTSTAPGALYSRTGSSYDELNALMLVVGTSHEIFSARDFTRRGVLDGEPIDDGFVPDMIIEYLSKTPEHADALVEYMKSRLEIASEVNWEHYLMYVDSPTPSLREGVL